MNYASANAFLDELVRWRVRQGMVGVSVQWPAVRDVGMAAAMDERFQLDEATTVEISEMCTVLEHVLRVGSRSSAVQTLLPRAILSSYLPAPAVNLLNSLQKTMGASKRSIYHRDRSRITHPSEVKEIVALELKELLDIKHNEALSLIHI